MPRGTDPVDDKDALTMVLTSTNGESVHTTAPADHRRRTVTTHTRDGEQIALAVHEYGPQDAETVLLVHGWPDTHQLWSGVIALLARSFHVVAYDVRGHGESTNPARTADFALADLAGDLFAVIDAVSPNRPVHLIAHDWGSVTGWEAVCEPDAQRRIASFTSISGPNLDHLGAWVRDRLARPTPANLIGPLSQLLSSAYTVFFMAPILPRVFFRLAGSEANWARALWFMERMPRTNLDFAPSLREDMINGLRIYRANIFQRLLHPRERRTSVPVQLLVNTRDIAVRPAGYDDTGRWVRRFQRLDLPAGHWLPYADPAAIARAATEFIATVSYREEAR